MQIYTRGAVCRGGCSGDIARDRAAASQRPDLFFVSHIRAI